MCPGWCGYLHALNLVSLVRVPCWFVWLVLLGSGYLHALNLVSLVRVVGVARVLVGSDYLHALNLVSLVRVPCWFVLVGVAWFVWLVCWLEVVTCIP